MKHDEKMIISPGYLRANWNRLRGIETGDHMVEVTLQDTKVASALSLSEIGNIRLLLPIEPREEIPDNLSSDNIHIQRDTFAIGGKNRVCADITCLSSELEQPFAELSSDIIQRIEAGDQSIVALSQAIREFRRLLKFTRAQSVPTEKIVGLMGELTVLSELSEISTDAWRAWNGQLGEPHDYLKGKNAIEVKSTLHSHEPIIEISSTEQLYPPYAGNLYLVFYTFTPNSSGTHSVPTFVSQVRNRLNDSKGLDERLRSLGFDSQSPDAWGEIQFTLVSTKIYRVVEGFPRLDRKVISNLPDGVSHLRYRINLCMAEKFRIKNESEYGLVFKQFMGA